MPAHMGHQATHRHVRLLNEQGRSSPGAFVGPNIFVASAWQGGVQGTLSPDGPFIDWSNGTRWRR